MVKTGLPTYYRRDAHGHTCLRDSLELGQHLTFQLNK